MRFESSNGSLRLRSLAIFAFSVGFIYSPKIGKYSHQWSFAGTLLEKSPYEKWLPAINKNTKLLLLLCIIFCAEVVLSVKNCQRRCGRLGCRRLEVKGKGEVAHTRLPSVRFQIWSLSLAVSLQVTWVINPVVGCHYFLPGLQLLSQPLRGLPPISLLGEQRRDGCEQFA